MTIFNSTRLASLVLSGSLAAASLAVAQPQAPAPSVTPPPAAQQPPAPVERSAPPRGHSPANAYRGPAMHGKMIAAGGHGPMGHGSMGSGFHIVPPGMWWRDANVVQRLSLTADQTKKMDDIFQQSRLQLIDLKANIEKQNAMLEPMLSANPVDQAKTLAQIDKVAQARADLEKADAKMLLGIRGVLTPEQWTKLQAHDAGMPGPGGDHGPHGSGRGPRPGGPADLVAPLPEL